LEVVHSIDRIRDPIDVPYPIVCYFGYKDRHWPKITIFHTAAPLGGSRRNIFVRFGTEK